MRNFGFGSALVACVAILMSYFMLITSHDEKPPGDVHLYGNFYLARVPFSSAECLET
jgi:hypothetical protein